MTRKILTNILRLLPCLSFLPTISLPSSCSTQYNIQEIGKIDGTDWYGVNAGNFLPIDYTIDTKTMSITYNDGYGIRAYNLTIPNYVIYGDCKFKVLLGKGCFANNNKISGSVQLNKFINNIPDKCFANCYSLTSVIFLKKPRYIGMLAFANCPLLGNFLFLDSSFHISKDVFSDLKSIGDFALNHCTMFSNDLVFGTDLSYLGEYCFNACIGIPSVNFLFCPNIWSITKGAFAGCNGIVNVWLPPNIERLDDESFKGCSLLQSVILPFDNMSLSLGVNTFYGCSNLYNFSKPVIFKEIGEACFSATPNLIDKPWMKKYGLDYIPSNAFSDCNMGYISFEPDGPRDFGDYAFAFNKDLCYLDFSQYDPNHAPQWTGQHIFDGANTQGTILMNEPTIMSPEWYEFFARNGIEIDSKNHWKIVSK